jgi:hypothetical protein
VFSMALRLTPDMLAGAYEFLRTTELSICGNF